MLVTFYDSFGVTSLKATGINVIVTTVIAWKLQVCFLLLACKSGSLLRLACFFSHGTVLRTSEVAWPETERKQMVSHVKVIDLSGYDAVSFGR